MEPNVDVQNAMPKKKNTVSREERHSLAQRVTLVSVVANVMLSVTKVAAGVF